MNVQHDHPSLTAGSRRHLRLILASLVAMLSLVISMPALAAQAGAQVLGSGGSDNLDTPPDPSCADPVFTTAATYDPMGNPTGTPRFGESTGLVTSFDVPGFTADPGLLHFDEVITQDAYATRPTAAAQTSERVHFDLLLGAQVVASTPATPDVADGSRSAWVASSLGSVDLPDGADGLRIVHHGDGASPNSLIVTGLCLRSEPALSTLPDEEPAEVTPATEEPGTEPAEVAPATEEPGVGPNDGTSDGTIRPPGIPAEALPVTVLPQLALTGADSSLLATIAALFVVTGVALVVVDRRRAGRRPQLTD